MESGRWSAGWSGSWRQRRVATAVAIVIVAAIVFAFVLMPAYTRHRNGRRLIEAEGILQQAHTKSLALRSVVMGRVGSDVITGADVYLMNVELQQNAQQAEAAMEHPSAKALNVRFQSMAKLLAGAEWAIANHKASPIADGGHSYMDDELHAFRSATPNSWSIAMLHARAEKPQWEFVAYWQAQAELSGSLSGSHAAAAAQNLTRELNAHLSAEKALIQPVDSASAITKALAAVAR